MNRYSHDDVADDCDEAVDNYDWHEREDDSGEDVHYGELDDWC